MQHVTDEVKLLLEQHAKITLTAYLDGVEIGASVATCSLKPRCGSEDAFSFGNACATEIVFVVAAALRNLEGRSVSVVWSVDEHEYPLFAGKVKKGTVTAGRTTIEAWDAMFYGGSDSFAATYEVKSDVDAATAFRTVASAMGVEADPQAMEMLSGIIIEGGLGGLPEDMSNSAVTGHIAGLVGGNAWISRTGQLAICRYTETNYEVWVYEGGASKEGPEYRVTGITLRREDAESNVQEDGTTEEDRVEAFSAGDGSLMIDNPLADQTAVDRCFEVLKAMVIQPGAYSFPGGLLLEPGDLFMVHTLEGVCTAAAVSISIEFDGGIRTEVSCGGAVDLGGAPGQINQAIATLIADYAKLRTLVAENATIVNARIDNLRVEDIVAGKIRSTDFESVQLLQIYPEENLYPSEDTLPSEGEEIVRGLEIDFAEGVIRGVFFSDTTDALEQRIKRIEDLMGI